MSQISIRFRQTLNPLWVLSFPSVHLLLTRSYEKINGVATMRRCPCGKHVFKTRYVYKPPMPKPPLFLDSKRKPLVVLILSNHSSTSNFKHQPGTKKHKTQVNFNVGRSGERRTLAAKRASKTLGVNESARVHRDEKTLQHVLANGFWMLGGITTSQSEVLMFQKVPSTNSWFAWKFWFKMSSFWVVPLALKAPIYWNSPCFPLIFSCTHLCKRSRSTKAQWLPCKESTDNKPSGKRSD